jgi:DNA invertase Pin-like site-specific DNA recombinase
MNKPVARIYQRVSTESQDLTRQESLRADAEAKGYIVVATYSEKASGTSENRDALQRMLADLNDGDTIIAEHLDRITRLPLDKAESLMAVIKAKGAKVSVPGLIDLPKAEEGIAGIVMDAMQAMLLKMALYQCRADYETRRERQRQGIARVKAEDAVKPLAERKNKGRKADTAINAKIVELRATGLTIAAVAKKLVVSESQVKLILRKHAAAKAAA